MTKSINQAGIMAHAFKPSTERQRISVVQGQAALLHIEFKASHGYTSETLSKNQKE